MSRKAIIMLGMIIGSTIGSILPVFFGGDSLTSIWSLVIGPAVGGFLGIYIAFRISN